MKAINIKTEYLKNPLCIDIDNPRIMWNCEGGITQTAYRIATDEWDSGKVKSRSMHGTVPVVFKRGKRVNFKIKLWDEKDCEGEWSEECFFEYGIKNWSGEWITGNYTVDKSKRYPVDCFLKKFAVKKEVVKARLYITACGIYCATLNGEKFSMPLAPGITDYNKRIQYQTYDITSMLKHMNTLEIQLADGWYRGSTGAWGITNQYGTQTKFIAELEIFYADGEVKKIFTDGTWNWCNDGEIRFADNKDGEIVDARMSPSYGKFAKVTNNNVVPVCSNNVPIAEKERFKPTVSKTPSGKTLLEFPNNLAGYISFSLRANAGEKIKMRFGEMLDKNGELTLKNIQCSSKKKTTPLQKIEYICKDGENNYKTKFAIFGFKYVEIETDIDLTDAEFTAIAVHSNMEETGFFDSSNELLNKLVDATKWSTKSNSVDLPTDCPTRERHGWTGDAQIFFTTAAFLFDYAAFSEKYVADIYDWQKKNGKLPQIVPPGGVDFYMSAMDGCVGWADAGVLIPYRFWKQYGDKRILEKYYSGMKKYAEFMKSHCGKPYPTAKHVSIPLKNRKYLNNFGQAYGEWAEPKDVNPQTWKTCVITHPETATAYTSYVMECMAEIADALGKADDAKDYKAFSNGNKESYRALMRSKQYSLDTDRQAQLVRGIYFNLLDEKQTEYAKKRLVVALENYGWRLGTGFLSTPLILDVLADINIDYAYKLLENEKMPGWLFMTKMGATTIWESWEGTEAQGGIGSLNHYSKGAVCEWLFRSMCGINIDGENRFVIKPMPGGHFSFAKASYKSVFGEVKSGWKKGNGEYKFEVEIPSNCTAEVILPNGEKHSVHAGKHEF